MLEKQDLQQIETILDKKFDDFAVIVRHGFDETNQRIEEVNQNLSGRIDETNQRIDRLTTAIDGFIVLYQKVDQEVVMLRSRIERLEETVQRLQMQSAGAR